MESITVNPLRRILLFFLLCSTGIAQRPIAGFTPAHEPIERRWEEAFLQIPDATRCREFLFNLTLKPHHAGSPGDRRTAEYVDSLYKSFGLKTEIVEYWGYIPYPVEVSVEILEPEHRKLQIKENLPKVFEEGALVPFNAYTPSGDITGEIVYVNYGLEADYKKLHELGISVKGKIALARYGGGYRGLKVEQAEQHGAIGVILYSDPIDDGYVAGDIFPRGPMRPWDAVQRGSINNGTKYIGDPLTPGWAATKEAKRLSAQEAAGLPKIPTTPISYEDAQHLLKTLGGTAAPRETTPGGVNWQGGLPFTYHIGPGPTKVRLILKMDFQIRPIWNNIAVIPGTEEPEKKIIFGSHRDAWVYGALDPNGGSATLIELGRTLSELMKQGWKPRRTLVLAHWDGEEYSIIGSTEWGEEHGDDLKRNAIVYLNFDSAIGGPNFNASSVPSLDKFIRDLTREVIDPKTNVRLFSAWWKKQNPQKAKSISGDVPDTASVPLGRIGGGSDHTVFLDHLGVPSASFGFSGPQGIYHSAYDNFEWMEKFGDPGFQYHAAAVKLQGLAALRLAGSDILPFDYSDYASEAMNYINQLEKKIAAEGIQNITLAGARKKALEWKEKAMGLTTRCKKALESGNVNTAVNFTLMQMERDLTEDRGLPGREWYKHRIYTPSGYNSVALAGIADALETGDVKTANDELQILLKILDRVIDSTESALRELR